MSTQPTSPRILVAEDSSAMRTYVRTALAAIGISDVTEAASGFEALRLLSRERFDLVVSDINMPDINGLELISFLRHRSSHRETPILIISTEAASRDRDRALTLGANHYLVKPFSEAELTAAVGRFVSTARER